MFEQNVVVVKKKEKQGIRMVTSCCSLSESCTGTSHSILCILKYVSASVWKELMLDQHFDSTFLLECKGRS